MTADIVTPIMALVDALLPYAVLAIPVSVGTQHGLAFFGWVLERRRPTSHAVVGLALAAWCLTAGWAGFIGFEVESSRSMQQANVDGTLWGVADSPSLILAISHSSPWTLAGLSFGAVLAVLVMLPKAARAASARHHLYAED